MYAIPGDKVRDNKNCGRHKRVRTYIIIIIIIQFDAHSGEKKLHYIGFYTRRQSTGTYKLYNIQYTYTPYIRIYIYINIHSTGSTPPSLSFCFLLYYYIVRAREHSRHVCLRFRTTHRIQCRHITANRNPMWNLFIFLLASFCCYSAVLIAFLLWAYYENAHCAGTIRRTRYEKPQIKLFPISVLKTLMNVVYAKWNHSS